MKLSLRVLFAVFLLSFNVAKAQQTHYIYIQTNDKQPFYIKKDNKVYSSSASGYLILSKLVDSTYNFSIGFPKNEWPQQNFTCTINNNDLGFLLKNFGDKGWGLFNLQTLDVVMSANQPAKEKDVETVERTDSFSNMLSVAVNDPNIKRTEKKREEEIKQDTAQPVQTADTIVAVTTPQIVPGIVNRPIVNAQPVKRSTIIKLLYNTNAEGTDLVYLDFDGDKKDTIRIFIPAEKVTAVVQQNNDVATTEPLPPPPPPVVKPQPKVEDKKFIDIEMPVKKDSAAIVDTALSITNTNKATVANNGCKNFASDEDFLKLRKKMAGSDNNDAMISAAKKIFKSKCFTTDQIKNLGTLFLDDKARYEFFELAYSYVSDTENFNSLQSQLTDAYYLKRFKAMVNP